MGWETVAKIGQGRIFRLGESSYLCFVVFHRHWLRELGRTRLLHGSFRDYWGRGRGP